MHYSIHTIGDSSSISEEKRAAVFGHMVLRCAAREEYSGMTLQELLERLNPPVLNGQFRIYFSIFGVCIGFATWAFLSPEIKERLLENYRSHLKTYEWNEGSSLWIMDFVAEQGAGKVIAADLRDNVLSKFESVTYCRRKLGRTVYKFVERNGSLTYFKQSVLSVQSGPL